MAKVLNIALIAMAMSLSAHVEAQSADTVAEIRPLVSDIRDLQVNIRDMDAQEATKGITVHETADSVVIAVASDVLFEFDSAELSGQAQDTLAEVAKKLNETPKQSVKVVGHTDARGADTYNQKLSLDRAKTVVKYLTQNGVKASRMKAEGRGESEPVAPNEIQGADNPDGRAQNRRVEFILPKS
ncbi:hypothetical protein BOTU111921_04760 [Bordetella tumbae]|uniref:OmpA family protein n=1 Tax=Bordetella tumbae TaxID=1649139 RepID=UPI0039EF7C91